MNSYVHTGSSAKTKSFLKSKKPVSADSPGKVKVSENLGSSRSPRGKLTKHALVKKSKPDRGKVKAGREVCHDDGGWALTTGPTATVGQEEEERAACPASVSGTTGAA